MSGFILLGVLFIAIVKWYKSHDLQNRIVAIALTISSVFLMIRTYFYHPTNKYVGYEVIFVYLIWLISYVVINSKDYKQDDE